MGALTDFFILIYSLLSVVVVICFFYMCANVTDTRKNTEAMVKALKTLEKAARLQLPPDEIPVEPWPRKEISPAVRWLVGIIIVGFVVLLIGLLVSRTKP